MLSVTGINRFFYLRDFTDMRCKHSRVLSIIREQLHRVKFADKNRFGNKRQKVKSEKVEELDLGKDEDDFDGTSRS